MRLLSEDLRKRIIDKREAGYGPTDISNLFGVSRRAIYRLYERYDRTGNLRAMRPGRHCGSELDAYQEQILGWIDKRADLTLEQLQERCLVELNLKVSVSNLDRVLRLWGLSYKKTLFAKEQKRPDVQELRKLWRQLQKQSDSSMVKKGQVYFC